MAIVESGRAAEVADMWRNPGASSLAFASATARSAISECQPVVPCATPKGVVALMALGNGAVPSARQYSDGTLRSAGPFPWARGVQLPAQTPCTYMPSGARQ